MTDALTVVVGDTVENVYRWIDENGLDIDDVRVVVTPDQLRNVCPSHIVLVNGWTKNKRLGEILELLFSCDPKR